FVIAGMISKLTGARTTVLGKPSLEAMRFVSRRLGVPMRDIAVVGDDPQLEIPMAHKGGALAIGVHSGLSKPEDFARLPRGKRPHLSISGVKELLELYRSGT
ncbi:MAG TPA: HAD hydrolase-like protein, partial [Steroidobacteraceae bacterium]